MEAKLKPTEINLKLKNLVQTERKITAEIITLISEIDRRKLFIEMGFSSLFAYLTEEIGYSASSAQRRIEAARISRQVYGVSEKLKTGAINLSTLSMAAQAIREKSKTCKITSELKQDLILKIENKNVKETQVILAQTLDLPVVNFEKIKYQQDESLRLELTLNRSQNEKLQKAKEVASHALINPNLADLIEFLADFYVQKKGPDQLATKKMVSSVAKCTSASEVKNERYVSAALRRKIFQRDQSCQWREKGTQKICGSKHQLEIHHQKPLWAGGTSSEENLLLTCRTHNLHAYRKEAQIKLL